MERDIVERLRAMAGPIVPNVCTEAADEIERLRKQLRLTNIDNFNTIAEVSMLRAERDEARRWVCNMKAQSVTYVRTAEHFAKEHAWDCFKEDSK